MANSALLALGARLAWALLASGGAGLALALLEVRFVTRLTQVRDVGSLLRMGPGGAALAGLAAGRVALAAGLGALEGRLQRGLAARLLRHHLATLLRTSPYASLPGGRAQALEELVANGGAVVAWPFQLVAALTREPLRLLGLGLPLLGGGPLMGLYIVALAVGVASVARWQQRRIEGIYERQHEALGTMMRWAHDGLDHQGTWLSAGGLEELERRVAQGQRLFLQETARGQQASTLVGLLFRLASCGAVLGGVWLLAVQRGHAPRAVEVAAFAVAASWLQGPLMTLLGLSGGWTRFRTARKRLAALLANPLVEPTVGTPSELTPPCRELSLSRVSFAYGPRRALHRVDLRWRAGSCVGIAGPSGSGKSTLVRLMARLAVPTEGELRVDGVELSALSAASLRAAMAVMLQPPELVRGTLRDNLLLGGRRVDEQRLWAVLRDTALEELVLGLPAGLETWVGDDGLTVSTGQAVRLALARVLVAAPAIALLDEPTASLDGRTAAQVVGALERFIPGRMVCLVSHDPRVLALCDEVVELEDGRVARRTTRRADATASFRRMGRATRPLDPNEAP